MFPHRPGRDRGQGRGVEVGGDDYLTKAVSVLDELIARVRAMVRSTISRRRGASSGVFRYADLVLDEDRLEVARVLTADLLTPTEFRLLRFLCSTPGGCVKDPDPDTVGVRLWW